MPASVPTVTAWLGNRRFLHAAAALSGLLIIGWIVADVALLRESGVLHAIYLAVGSGPVV